MLRALKNFSSVVEADFQAILCRDDGFDPKPSPHGVREAVRQLGADPRETLMVGDHWLDVSAGNRAGVRTAYLTNGSGTPPTDPAPDFIFSSIKELANCLPIV